MGWIQKLCEVYDAMAGTEDCDIVPAGFADKKIEFNVIISKNGDFVTAHRIAEEEQSSMVPSTPQAEGRSGIKPMPFPLAEQLKYLVVETEKENSRFATYMRQLSDWCQEADAPACLDVVYQYLEKQTLLADLEGVSSLKLRFRTKNGKFGLDADKIVCFSVQIHGEENKVWLRSDIRESWSRYMAQMVKAAPKTLCYATGQMLPQMEKYPPLLDKAKLISSKDTEYPLQYKGRFVEDQSAVTMSYETCVKAHSALRWLLKHQGFQRYGIYMIAWNMQMPVLHGEEDNDDEKPDSFEVYAKLLWKATAGYAEKLLEWKKRVESSEEAQRRMNEVVILGMEAATEGRMSINYYQEIPGNRYVERVDAWERDCCWRMPGKDTQLRTPSWMKICEAVMGGDVVETAKRDTRCEKSATKLMRRMQIQLLNCVANESPLPEDFVKQAFRRAVQPLRFTKKDGAWDGFAWRECVATACALIRKRKIQSGGATISPTLDRTCMQRDYLYGRLLAAAHKLERDSTGRKDAPTMALRRMTKFVQSPTDAWLRLFEHLSVYLKDFDAAQWYLRQFGEIERLFRAEDRRDPKPLSYDFLIGFDAQLNEMYQKSETRQPRPVFTSFAPPKGRDALYGCLAAIADVCECRAASMKDENAARAGDTNALRLTRTLIADPARSWMHLHDKLIPYLEQVGVKNARFYQSLICRAEQAFAKEERRMHAPLKSEYLYGFFCMRHALTTGTLDQSAWQPLPRTSLSIETREDAFGALLALENLVERRALDREATEDEQRASNAMRYLTQASRRPLDVTEHLFQKMEPYLRKLHFPQKIEREKSRLLQIVRDNGWDHDAPLTPDYLHAFYLYRL